MLPDFVLPEITVRECGESPVFTVDEHGETGLVLTLGITHAMEQECLDLDILESSDGKTWSPKPTASFRNKFYCGTYQHILEGGHSRCLKAVWRVSRWGRSESPPFFRFYLFAQEARSRAFAGAA
jgi:hypothetical protein